MLSRAAAALAAAIALPSLLRPAATAEDRQLMDRAALIRGVRVVDAPGLPGPVCVFGESAFAVVTGRTKQGAVLPLVAASRFGRGRVVAFGKDGFLGAKALAMGDTARLVANSIRWAAGKSGPVRVGVHQRDALVEHLRGLGLDARVASLGQLQQVDVLMARPNRVPRSDLGRLSQFVAQGGGLIVAELGWGWLQLNPGKTLTQDFGANLLLARMGIVWADGILDRTDSSGYRTDAPPPSLSNASRALDAALAHAEHRATLSVGDVAQVSTVLAITARSMPATDAILLPRLRALASNGSLNVTPTPKKPVPRSDLLSRLVLTMQLREALRKPPRQVAAHPAAAVFPGAVSSKAQRVTRTVGIDTAVPRWHSTGLYAPPGGLITVRVPDSAAGKRLKARIGATHCRIWGKDKWLRAPEITREFVIRGPATPAANPFGGPVYIVAPPKCALGAMTVTVSGAIEAPWFRLGKTPPSEWRRVIRHRPAPWAELQGNQAILTVPSTHIRDLDDPTELLQLWDRILDTCADLAAWPPNARKWPERYVADVQLCAGYMHAGYPIMIPLRAVPALLDRQLLVTKGAWGLFHETGHNHQSRDWTFGGAGEVTVNLFTLYLLDKLCGIDPSEGRMAKPKIRSDVRRHFAAGCPFDQWKRKPFVALAMYVQMQQAFEWEPFRAVFAEYRGLPDGQRPKTDDDKRDQWLVRFSRRVGKNLGPFFQTWGVPTSEQARSSLADLPVWVPASIQR